MIFSARTTLAALVVSAFAGCATQSPRPAANTDVLDANPVVQNAANLNKLTRNLVATAQQIDANTLNPPSQLCVNMFMSIRDATQRIIQAADFYNQAPSPSEAYLAALSTQVDKTNYAFDVLTRRCPAKAKELNLPVQLKQYVSPTTDKVTINALYRPN